MQQRKLRAVIGQFDRGLRDCRLLATDAHQWAAPGAAPRISLKRRDSMIELAFLRVVLAWETFLEQAFILYLLGHAPPRGKGPRRFAFPPDRRAAEEWLLPETGRGFAVWNDPNLVSTRAERFFRAGRPFASVLRGSQNLLSEVRTIRNAVAHDSPSAHDKFVSVVRTRLGTQPPGVTVGSYLGTVMPGSTPPVSFFEFYVTRVDTAAQSIVPR